MASAINPITAAKAWVRRAYCCLIADLGRVIFFHPSNPTMTDYIEVEWSERSIAGAARTLKYTVEARNTPAQSDIPFHPLPWGGNQVRARGGPLRWQRLTKRAVFADLRSPAG